ncbi:Flp family type IVb pilin [Allomesorhizobium camelthorni]|uniref:Flp family type IVb pilin n=1 Tax=Allomesorhizobium camelthorni TaxID=475069 RepID=A0A6G4WB76_9HYPH|nr:Flp family type IVb pilin [Mesorhizobium camelthorni]NGO51588.1 Flp family type IVb pilin [Mesorhizobium camelthorni]
MRLLIRRFLKDDSAATAIEYGLIATVISLAIFGSVGSFADMLEVLWGNNSNKLVEAFNQ